MIFAFQIKGSSFHLSSWGSLQRLLVSGASVRTVTDFFGERACSGHFRIWCATFHGKVESGFSVLFLSPPGDIPLQVLSNDPQRVDCPNVTDGVAALVGWPTDGICRAGAPHVVREGSVGLQGVTNKEYLKHTVESILFLLSSIQIPNCLRMLGTHPPVDMLCSADNHNSSH